MAPGTSESPPAARPAPDTNGYTEQEPGEELTGEGAAYEDEVEAFMAIDRDGGGGISVAELKLYFHDFVSWGKELSDEEVDGEFREVDADGDGQLSFEEFIVKWRDGQPEEVEAEDESFDEDEELQVPKA